MAFARLYISKFSRGKMPSDPPTTTAATPFLGQTNARPPPKKNFLTITHMALHGMIKFGRDIHQTAPSKKIVVLPLGMTEQDAPLSV